MRNMIKAVGAVGVTALILSGAAIAAGPEVPVLGINFGVLTEGAGMTNATCAAAVGAGAKCTELAKGTGFMQRQIDVGGHSFIQTVINDGSFHSEDFVKIQFGSQAGGIEGVASKLSLTDSTNGTFSAASTIKSGWAHDSVSGNSVAELSVNLSQNAPTDAKYFKSDFSIKTKFDTSLGTGGENVVESMSADQTVNLGNATDKQRFYTAIKPATGAAVTNYTFTGGTGGVTYAAGNQIQVVWIGQSIDGLGAFGSENFSNKETSGTGAGTATTVSSLTTAGPFEWGTGSKLETQFGSSPSF